MALKRERNGCSPFALAAMGSDALIVGYASLYVGLESG